MAGERGSSLPPATRNKLHKLFCLIEKEFESLYLENAALQERLDRESLGPLSLPERVGEEVVDGVSSARSGSSSTATTSKVFSSSGRLKSHTNKLKYQTNKIMSGLKTTSGGWCVTVNPVKRYSEHRDGVWEVAASRLGLPVLATASADQTARVWGMHSGACLLQALNTNNQTQNCI